MALNWVMDDQGDPKAPAWMLESLERSQAQIEAGQTVPPDRVLDRLRASIERMQVARNGSGPRPARKA